MDKTIKVTFEPEGKDVYVLPGTTVLEAAGEAGIIIDSPCGRKGKCGKCRVAIPDGDIQPNAAERELLGEDELKTGVRLACQVKISSPVTIEVPQSSRLSAQKILTSDSEDGKVRREVKPGVSKVYMELPPQTLERQVSDMDLIRSKVENFGADIYIIRRMPDLIREAEFKVTCVFSNGEFISVERGDTTGSNYGVAVDLGTTTLVGTLMDLNNGRDMAVSTLMNPQVTQGDDVISRIKYTIDNEKGLEELHSAVVKSINRIIGDVVQKAGIKRENIYKVAVAGNSTMQHLFLNISPRNLGFIPFTLAMREGIQIKAKRLGVEINEDGVVYVFPSIAGFVGGDTLGVILATRLFRKKGIRLAVDIGTNGEIVLGNKERLLCASTAAGPAFEGAKISRGMRASKGAIEKVVFNEDVTVNTIGNTAPAGICGSGLIDAVAEMRRTEIIDETGKILSPSVLSNKVTPKIMERIVEDISGNKFLLAESDKPGKPIFLTQRDVREVQLAKGAIFAGIKILEKELGVKDEDIERVLLAGAFGNFIRRENARTIGLIPDIPIEKIKFVGNAASTGAKLVLLSENIRRKVEDLSKSCRYIELSTSPGFQDEFADAMLFTKTAD